MKITRRRRRGRIDKDGSIRKTVRVFDSVIDKSEKDFKRKGKEGKKGKERKENKIIEGNGKGGAE
jgi:hypothetical protein